MGIDYLEEYRIRVQTHIMFVRFACLFLGGISKEQIENHDLSKFSKEEFEPYARWYCTSDKDPVSYSRAWLHHIHNNPHHWQYHCFADGFSLSGSGAENGVLPMPVEFAREMVADRIGASLAYTGSWDMSKWLTANFGAGKVMLHSQTRKYVDDLLVSIGYKIDHQIDDRVIYRLVDSSIYPPISKAYVL